MLRVVLDTDVLLSAAIQRGPSHRIAVVGHPDVFVDTGLVAPTGGGGPIHAARGEGNLCIAICDTFTGVTTAISLRLDDEVALALEQLRSSTGSSRSEAVRRAILDSAARQRRRRALAAEVALLEADEEDVSEVREVAELMESMRASG